PSAQVPVAAQQRTDAAPIRALVAEDNPVNQRVIVRMLERLGCQTDVVSNGLQAVEAASARAYQVVFMDCQMPELDRPRAAVEIRRREGNGRRTPIVAVTANAMQGDRERCLDAGMDGYIAKPVNVADLAHAIERWGRAKQSGAC